MTTSGDYTGHADASGLPAVRTLSGLTLTKMSVGPIDNNAYLLVCTDTCDALLIDAANDADRLLAEQQSAVRLIGIVTTHRHADHWQALAEIVTATGAPVLAGAADADDLPVPVATRLQHGDRIAMGSVMLGVIALRGHTPGSVAIRYDEPSGPTHLFTGDSLFPGGPGRTASPEDFTSLMNDLQARVFDALPDDTWVYPGHGDDATLGAERPHLAAWRARGW
jgi:glyoxylase-like metal-dependent hydrolase (beta-lactamase superfamily II)